jgi:hypothetical protein
VISVVSYLWNDPNLAAPSNRGGRGPDNPNAGVRPDLMPSYRDFRRGRVSKLQERHIRTMKHTLPRGVLTARSFKHAHVEQQAALFAQHLTVPHRYICVTDELPAKPTKGIEWVLMPEEWKKLGDLRSPEGLRFPSCYRRLGGFSEEARRLLGERVLLTDIDAVPVRNLDNLVRRDEDFVGWRPFRDWGTRLRFGGGSYLMATGTRTKVYTDFKGAASVQEARAAGFRGSDQAWISYKLADKEPYFDRNCGIYSIRDLGNTHELPKDARIVHFNGNDKPWSYRGPAMWVAERWNAR